MKMSLLILPTELLLSRESGEKARMGGKNVLDCCSNGKVISCENEGGFAGHESMGNFHMREV